MVGISGQLKQNNYEGVVMLKQNSTKTYGRIHVKLKMTHGQAVSRGRAGGKIGGPERARVLSPKRRSEIARMGAEAKHENE